MVAIELSVTRFSIERPFTISVIVPGSENRPDISFPEIPGFTKKGISTSVTPGEAGGKPTVSQVITQRYQAQAAGRFVLAPFVLTVNGGTVRSEGAVLLVRPSAAVTASGGTTAVAGPPVPSAGAAFLSLRASQSAIYTGQGVGLTLSFFVADNYPYVLDLTALDKQLRDIIPKIRPVNAWEENLNIHELKPIPAWVGGKKFREFRLYQAVFFPLGTRPLRLPTVSLRLLRPRPNIGPPSSQPEEVVFSSKPQTVLIRPLPFHPLRGQVPVGTFRLEDGFDRPAVRTGQSVRYTFTVAGAGNIATLPTPTILKATAGVDVFPPREQQTVTHAGDRITGHKQFTYFIVPHHNGSVSLANQLRWIYFDPQTARYDTLRPRAYLQVGGSNAVATVRAAGPASASVPAQVETPADPVSRRLYAHIETLDSSRQSVNVPRLIRTVANVLIIAMLIGMTYVFFKK